MANGRHLENRKLEAIPDMSRVTLNFDLSKNPFVHL